MDYQKMQNEIEAILEKYGLNAHLIVATNDNNFTVSCGSNPNGNGVIHVIEDVVSQILMQISVEIPRNYN